LRNVPPVVLQEGREEVHQPPTGDLVSCLSESFGYRQPPNQITGWVVFYSLRESMPTRIDFLAFTRFSIFAAAPSEQSNRDPKKQGKVKKPDANLVSRVSPG
jgi:hypothetical protein